MSTIMNCLFDEAIDQLKQKGERFDCAFMANTSGAPRSTTPSASSH
jgi:hypothetical protein